VENSKEELGVKVGSPEMAAWKNIGLEAKNAIDSMKRNIEINESILSLAERREREEEALFKKN
jgi:hypothetical protein